MEYMSHPGNSFTVERSGNSYRVYSPSTGKEIRNPDTLRISNYLTGFTNLNFESWDRHLNDKQIDSLRNVQPATILTVTDAKGKKSVVPLYLKPVTLISLAQTDSTGQPLKFDMDRMYAFIKDGKELVTIQYFVFNRIFATLDDFDMEATRRKFRQ